MAKAPYAALAMPRGGGSRRRGLCCVRHNGLIVTVHGKGTFVADPLPEAPGGEA